MKFSIHAALAFGAAALVWAPAGAAEVRGRRQAKEVRANKLVVVKGLRDGLFSHPFYLLVVSP